MRRCKPLYSIYNFLLKYFYRTVISDDFQFFIAYTNPINGYCYVPTTDKMKTYQLQIKTGKFQHDQFILGTYIALVAQGIECVFPKKKAEGSTPS